jgi:SNARE protein
MPVSNQDLQDFNEQLNEIIKAIENVIEKDMPRLKGVERTEKCQYLRNRFNRGKQVHRSIMAELRTLSVAERVDWEKLAKGHEEKMGKLLQDVEWAENSTDNKDIPKKKSILNILN